MRSEPGTVVTGLFVNLWKILKPNLSFHLEFLNTWEYRHTTVFENV